MDNNRLTRAYLKLREARKALAKEFELADAELEKKQNQVGAMMLKFLADHKTDSVRTDAGTFYRQEELKPSGADWAAFYEWVAENNAFDFLERRITKKAVADYMSSHGNKPPPGVAVHREYVVRVRNSN